MKETLKKLNNFRLSSLLISIGSLVGLITVALCLILYQTSGTKINQEGEEVITNAFASNQALGMLFFIFAILAIVCGIVVIGKAFKFVMPKTRETPDHSLTWILLGENVFVLALLVLVFVLLGTETTRYAAGFVIAVVLGTLSIVYSALLVYPNIKCHYYMPELEVKK